MHKKHYHYGMRQLKSITQQQQMLKCKCLLNVPISLLKLHFFVRILDYAND